MRLEGKVAIVTGSGQGIGRATVLTLAAEGADIVVNDVNLSLAEKVAHEIESLGRRAQAIKADVSNSKQVNEMVSKAMAQFQHIDILVNNAGISTRALAVEMSEVQWDSMINVNLKGTFLCSQAVAREMIKQRRGKIVNIASTAARVARPESAAYAASKGGIIQLTKVMAIELGQYNINVNAICPGLTWTPLQEQHAREEKGYREKFQSWVDRIPMRHAARPEDIANAVLFLASSESDYIAGQEIVVDGGTCALISNWVWPKE